MWGKVQTAVLGTLLGLTFAGGAAAQSYVRADCRVAIAKTAGARFDDQSHRLWYRRFWTGDCGVLSFCQPGDPYWNKVVSDVVSRSPAKQKIAYRTRACRLGQAIGFEWARDNSIRRIDTNDLITFSNELSSAPDVGSALDQVEGEVHAKLGRR